jgi:DNA (cytosine-5)-methyltransferase 1
MVLYMIKILNLYAGIGGNRKLWGVGGIEVTAVEIDPLIAKIYQDFFPDDKVVVGDAHNFLLEHFSEFDFIWASPPCPTHSRIRNEAGVGSEQVEPVFPDMTLYQEIIFLKHFFKGVWVVENVISYYNPLIRPYIYHEHYFWSSFVIDGKNKADRGHQGSMDDLRRIKDFDLSPYKKDIDERKLLRNCTESDVGLYIFNMAFSNKQSFIKDF